MEKYRIASRLKGIEISGIRKLFDAAGPGSINLGLGEPDFDTPEHIKQGAIKALEMGMTGYTPNLGIPELREALCKKFSEENNLSYTPDQVIVTAGASEALHIIMQALVEDGDRVLFADPGFVSYGALALMAGGRPDGLTLDRRFCIDIEAAKEKMDGARILVINSPGNPTGAVEEKDSIRALVEYAGDAGVTVVSDEVYEHFIYDTRHWSAALFGEDVITVNATSKSYSMTGWRLGYLAGPKEYVEQSLKVHQYCQACASSISQYAALAAYNGPQDCVSGMRDEYRARRDYLYGELTRLGFDFPAPQGAFYLFVPMAQSMIEEIIKRGVIIVPGVAFGVNAPDYARICYAASMENMKQAVERISGVVR
jgi:aspartate aminotransferase